MAWEPKEAPAQVLIARGDSGEQYGESRVVVVVPSIDPQFAADLRGK
jgi:hypothetical protein